MSQWQLTVTDTVKYIIDIDEPVAQWKMHYTTLNLTATNHVLKGCSNPKLVFFATGETAMLFCNYILDQCLTHGLVS